MLVKDTLLECINDVSMVPRVNLILALRKTVSQSVSANAADVIKDFVVYALQSTPQKNCAKYTSISEIQQQQTTRMRRTIIISTTRKRTRRFLNCE